MPSSGQFRVRATGPNPAVLHDRDALRRVLLGEYILDAAEAPAWQVENCPADANRYCLRTLNPFEPNGGPPARAR
jgi:hypothetical protein